MRPLIYSMSVSLDGFIAGPGGAIDWSAPDEELHRFHNQQAREIGAHLCGRGLYEAMLPWETVDGARAGPVMAEFARIWRAIPKVVFSTTLSSVEGNARLASHSPADEAAMYRDLPDDRVVSVGGARLAAGLIQLDLIDEYRQFISPVILGGGRPYFPPLDQRLDLELLETRTFGSRVIYARYRRIRDGDRA
jgi:dihydrofolate reductase